MRLLLYYASAVLLQAQDFAPLERTAHEEMVRLNVPGAAIAIIRGDQVIYSQVLGVANVETGEPMRPGMLFRLGSTTKQLTAAAVVGLAVEGKLDLNAAVSKYIPGLPPRIGAVTANQLLSHTAGIRDEAPMYGSHDDGALGAGIHRWTDEWLFAEPGRVFSYSNPGYWLAGYLLESIIGMPYADAMEDRVFRPLGMAHTTLRPTTAMTYPLSQGHEVQAGKPVVVRPAADNTATWPAGSVFSNTADLARWTIAILNRRGLDPRVIDLMTEAHARYPGSDNAYGYGLTLMNERGVRLWDHTGSRAGYGSQIRMAPDQKVAIIVQTNRTGANLPATVAYAMQLLLPLARPGFSMKPRPLSECVAEDAARITGVWRNGADHIEIASRAGKLYLKRGGGTESAIHGCSATVLVTESGARFDVVAGRDGKPAYLHTGSRSFAR
jgi:CubicO group peptidase (beta-lactamase class C family)